MRNQPNNHIDHQHRRSTSIWLLIDRSGSMATIKDAVIEGVDGFIDSQRNDPRDVVVTIAQFDSRDPYEVLVERYPIEEVRSIRRGFQPRGGTPLYDAIGQLLDHAESSPRGEDRLVVVMTDGEENSSQYWRRDAIFERIGVLRRRGWTFVFLGANQDSYAVGRQLGFAEGSVSNFVADGEGTRMACESLARATSEWRRRSDRDRHESEGRFFGGVKEAERHVTRRRATTSSAASEASRPPKGWYAGFPCDLHDESWCHTCRPSQSSTTVYIVAGGSAYHRTIRCAGLAQGQLAVQRRGGQTTPIEAVGIDTAKHLMRFACQVCKPGLLNAD